MRRVGSESESEVVEAGPTDDLAGGAARVDVAVAGGELRGEAAADQRVQNAVAAVRHHRGVARQLVSLQRCVQGGRDRQTITDYHQTHHWLPIMPSLFTIKPSLFTIKPSLF